MIAAACRRGAVRQFALLVAVAVALALLEYFLIVRSYPRISSVPRHVARHFLLIVALQAVILSLCAVFRLVVRRLKSGNLLLIHFASVMFGLGTGGLSLLYVGGHFSLPVLGGLLGSDLLQVGALEFLRRLQAWGGIAALTGVTALSIGLLAGMIKLGRLMSGSLPILLDQIPRRECRGLVIALVVFYSAGLACGVRVMSKLDARGDDPIVALIKGSFISNTTGSNESNLAERLQYGNAQAFAANGKNIVVVVSDSLRSDHMPLYGYPRMTTPFLSNLAQGGFLHKVQTATSACSESVCGIFAILGSKLIAHAGNRNNFMLHQALKDRGYRTHFILSGSHTNYAPLPMLYGARAEFDHYADGDLSGKAMDDRGVLEALGALPQSQGEANFFFIFLMSSHVSGLQFIPHPPFQPQLEALRAEELFFADGRHRLTVDERQRNVNRYDNGIVQADEVIRQVFSTLQEKGYLANAVTFISADHGDALGERGLYAHTKYIYPEFTRIPLLIYDPSGAKYDNMEFADQTDIAVTALDRAGLPKPSSWDGQSLMAGPPRRIAFAQNDRMAEPPCRGVYLRQDEKLNYLMQCEDDQGKVQEEVFELGADPLGLKSSAVATPRSVIDEMRQSLNKEFPIRKNQL